jgi:hypothetical protein
VVVQLPGRTLTPAFRRLAKLLGVEADPAEDSPKLEPGWISASRLRSAQLYALPNGRRYALLEEAAH